MPLLENPQTSLLYHTHSKNKLSTRFQNINRTHKQNLEAFFKLEKHRKSLEWPELPTTTTKSSLPDYLELSGKCKATLDSIDISHGTDNRNKTNNIYIACWFDSQSDLSISPCNDQDTFQMRLKCPSNPSEILKVGSFLDMTDTETGQRKLFPLQTCGVHVSDLKSGKLVERCPDSFNDGLSTQLHIQCDNGSDLPLHAFKRSALRDVDTYNQAIKKMSEQVMEDMRENSLKYPNCAEPLVHGVTTAPFIGMPSMGIPTLNSHYSLLGAHINSMERTLPITLPCYFFTSALLHSNLTVDHINQMLDEKPLTNKQFVYFMGDVLTAFTKDAACVPYQRDATPTMGIQGFPFNIHMGISMTTTEDMSFLMDSVQMYLAGDKDAKRRVKPVLSDDATMPELQDTFRSKNWHAIFRGLGMDDCESTSYMILALYNTIKHSDFSVENIQSKLGEVSCFKNMTSKCHQTLSRFFTCFQEGISSKQVQVSTIVGMAGGASASEAKDPDNTQESEESIINMEAGGHCFAGLRVVDPNSGHVHFVTLEGTNATNHLHDEDMVQYKVKFGGDATKEPPYHRNQHNNKKEWQSIDSAAFLNLGARTLAELTKICANEQGMTSENDWTRKNDNPETLNKGHCRAQIALSMSKVAFYKWVQFVGFSLDPNAYSFVPCGRASPDDDLSSWFGCVPKETVDSKLNGIPITHDLLPPDIKELGDNIMQEVYRPFAPDERFHEIMGFWADVPPLHEINQNIQLHPDQKYVIMACMHSPASPFLVDLQYRAQSMLADEVNRLEQSENPQNKRIVMQVFKSGTGTSNKLWVPVNNNMEITFFKNLRKARENIGFNVSKY